MSITLLDDFLRTLLPLMSYHEGARFAMSVALAEDPDRFQRRRDGRVAEGGGLLNRYTG
jgi:hypothetical protein